MLTCSICGPGCVYVYTRGGEQGATELRIKRGGLAFVGMFEQPKGFLCTSSVFANSCSDLAVEGHASCLITWKVMKPLGQQNTAQLWAPKGK